MKLSDCRMDVDGFCKNYPFRSEKDRELSKKKGTVFEFLVIIMDAKSVSLSIHIIYIILMK